MLKSLRIVLVLCFESRNMITYTGGKLLELPLCLLLYSMRG